MSPTPEHAATSWEIAYADMAVHSALDVIGRKLTRSLPRSERHYGKSRLRQTDTWQRHTLVATSEDQVQQLTDGAFRFLDRTMPTTNPCLRSAIEQHVRCVVASSAPHDVHQLVSVIDRAGCLETG